MIKLHNLYNKPIYINAELIEKLEFNESTKIILTNKNRYNVKESVDEVVDKIIEYKREIRKIDYLKK